MKKQNKLTLAGVVLALVGLFIIGYYYLPDILLYFHTKDEQKIIETVDAEQLKNNHLEQGDIDFSSIDDVDLDNIRENAIAIDPSLMIAELTIPAVDLDIAVYKSLTNQTLLSGSAVMKHNMDLGEGNFSIAGHWGNPERGTYFAPLEYLEEGDVIRLTDKETIYEYIATDMKVVEPTAFYMLEDNQMQYYSDEADPIISLMRCYYVDGKDTGNRQFYIGVLNDSYPYDEELLFSELTYEEYNDETKQAQNK